MRTVLEPGWFREGGVWLKDHLSDGWEESSGAKTGQPLTKNKRAWIIMKSSVKACWGSEFEFWPISGGREKARWGNQLLEANQPAVESPAGGDNITEKIETPKGSKMSIYTKSVFFVLVSLLLLYWIHDILWIHIKHWFQLFLFLMSLRCVL